MPATVVAYSAYPEDTYLTLKIECLDCQIEWGWTEYSSHMHDRMTLLAEQHNKESHADGGEGPKMPKRDIYGRSLEPGVNVDAVDIGAGLHRMRVLGYGDPNCSMEVEYNLMRWARGEEEEANRSMSKSLSGVRYTDWWVILASAISAAAEEEPKTPERVVSSALDTIFRLCTGSEELPDGWGVEAEVEEGPHGIRRLVRITGPWQRR